MPFSNVIQRWFKEEWGGSLHLPDGWYGRPHDNQHALTSIDESGDALIFVLDRKLTLHFDGLESVDAQRRELILGPFKKLRFQWVSFGTDGERGTKEYQTGEVRIISGPR